MKKRAFTLIEIVMVIVVLGIVAMIGTNIITHMYEGYIRSRVINKLQADSEQILDQISKRLQYRIKDSVVASIDGNLLSYKKLSDPTITTNYNVLEWIGYDNEGMIGEWVSAGGINRFAGWSGFIDLDNASTDSSAFVTSGSRLDKTKIDIYNLSYDGVDLNAKGSGAAIIFKCSHDNSVASYGYTGATHSSVYPVHKTASNTQLIFDDSTMPSVDYCEHYYLAWSAYAIVPENVTDAKDANGNVLYDNSTPPNKIKDFDLFLYYNYQPWQNERYSSGKKALIAKHVSTFRFIQVGSTIRVKLCLRDDKTNYGFCKERAVY